MTKTFYTERDIEDLHRQGIMTITLTDEIVMTDLAYEKAQRLEMKMVQAEEVPPAAPIRPYINATASSTVKSISTQPAIKREDASRIAAVKARVRETVKSRLGSSVDMNMLDAVIDRVAKDLGLE